MRPLKNENRFSFFYFVLFLAIILLLNSIFSRRKIDEISYAQFKKLAEQPYRIEKCVISINSIRGTYIKDEAVYQEVKQRKEKEKGQEGVKEEESDPWALDKLFVKEKKGVVPFSTVRVHEDRDLVTFLEKNKVPFEGETESYWGAMFLSWGLPILLIVIFFIILMRRMNSYGRDVMSFGKSRAKITAEEDTKTTFNEVAGCDEAKEELSEIVEFLKSPKKFETLGGKIPKGALLVGPPGTGKTLLARAVAGEAGVPFFNISGSEFVEMFVGVGASRVRDLFGQAKAKSPCIIFIDEIDAVGRHRGAGLGGGHDEREQTLNQLLAEMDGFESNKGIVILAATNRPDILDPALLRPGRFDRQIVIDQPDIRGREQILKIHAKGKPLSKEVDLKTLARRTPGFSGADLANVMNEAALLAARKNKKQIEQPDIAEAVERVLAGPERRSRIISPKEKKVTAYHEVGHAVIAALHPHAYSVVHKVSIIPRGRALGYVLHMKEEDKYSMRKEELLANICIALGGRVTEEILLGIISTGAQNDLEQVTDMARSMVARYGMSEKLGPLAYERDEGYVFLGKNFDRKTYFGGSTMDQIDREVKRIVLACYEQAIRIISQNKELIERLVKILLQKETMEGSEFMSILKKLQNNEPLDPQYLETDNIEEDIQPGKPGDAAAPVPTNTSISSSPSGSPLPPSPKENT